MIVNNYKVVILLNKKEEYCTVRGYELQRRENKLLSHSMEDYLEMIYRQCLMEGYTRINTLSDQLNVQASSASKMVQKLTKLGLLSYKKYGIIHLTEKGRSIGEFLLYRHNTLKEFLKLLTVDSNLLSQTEALEHNINWDTLKRLDLLIQFFHEEPQLNERLKNFINERSK
ncbi:iron dependent repressor, metal binding and dimerization domain protein [Alkaliphilus peptidifermentans]|uniref:Manganese transport regulator n=1 Tax=Alkaliphilus peptidifermentans DSM 18978 TaxID=1120976 RepID=A0A1G5BLV2_9FIRM|nr:iron dependent repressor, metal binding and dimerization domain protein [Alkaliphilus peptidifermentans]SCX91046.1 iron (metal) dependent repressor, DtxR family [Alkaliphilus peptidifermentans DSM 18978]